VWVSIPLLIRLADRGIRWYRRNLRPSRILGAEFMGDDIVALRISRPKGFHFRCRTPLSQRLTGLVITHQLAPLGPSLWNMPLWGVACHRVWQSVTRCLQSAEACSAHMQGCCHNLLLPVCRPGMYIYLCMPEVAQLQWHPISLAGSPSANSLAVLVSNSGAFVAPCQPMNPVLGKS
jgi:FAD-binding domain